MQFVGPTYRVSNTVPKREFPVGVIVRSQLRVWAISRWRGATEFATFFLGAGYRHLPPGSPQMFQIEEARMGGSGLIILFTNPFDA